MSAPSKEEIAPRGKEELVNWARIAVEHADHGDECKYRPLTRGQSVAMAKDIVALADENERLRAERAECLEVFGTLQGMAKKPMRSWETGDVIDARQVDELCEEMIEKLKGMP